MQGLLAHFGLLALFALLVAGGLAVPVPEELVQLTAGYLARRGLLPLLPAMAAAWAGIVTGDALFFWLARRHGRRLLETGAVARLLTPGRRAFLERHFARHAVLTVMVSRHASAFRLPAFALAALHGVRPLVFVAADAASALLSVPLVVGLGWLFAARLEELKRDVRAVELGVALAVGAALLAWWGWRAWRARRAARSR